MAGGVSGALINKAALASTPPQVLNWYLYFCAWIITTSGGIHGYNSSNMSGILKMHNFKESFNLAQYTTEEYANVTGWVISVIVIAGLGGALISAPMNDYLGRKKSLLIMSLLYCVGCVVQISTTSSINQVIGARAIEGFAGGAATVTGTMYIAEIAPKAVRGLLSALFPLNIIIGVALAYWGNYGSLLNISDTSHWQWRVPLLIQFIPGVTILAFLPFVIESPRWLAFKGRNEEALAALVRIRRLPAEHDFLLQEYTDIVGGVDAERGMSSSWVGLGKELVNNKSLGRRFALVMIAQVGFNFSGGNSITYYQTSLLSTLGIAGDDAYLFSGVYGLVKIVSVLAYAFIFAERFGRRKMILIGGVITTICVTYVAVFLSVLQENKAAAWVAVAAICIFAVGYGVGWSPVAFGLNGELFPNRLRAKMMSLCIAVQYLLNFILVRFFPNMTAAIGSRGPFILFAVVSAAVLVYIFFALPEVKGVAIEHMEELFDGKWYTNGLRGSRLNKLVRAKEANNAKTIHDRKSTSEHVETSRQEVV